MLGGGGGGQVLGSRLPTEKGVDRSNAISVERVNIQVQAS